MTLDPQVAAFYGDRLNDAPLRPASIEQARRDADATFNDKESWRLPVFSTEDRIAEPTSPDLVSVPVRVYRPFAPEAAAPALPVMVYFHGGGFVMHNIASHDLLCRKLALSCGCVLISAEYRLAPEHPWPACMEDGWTVLLWARRHAAEFSGDPGKLILAGDSAGASISAVLSLMLRDRRRTSARDAASALPEIGLQILCYGSMGCVDCNDSQTVRLFGQGGFVLPRPMLDWCMAQYVPVGVDLSNPYLNPGRAADLTDLPRTLSITAECDPLREDGEIFARRLTGAGNSSTLYRAPGMMHGFLLYWHKFDQAQEVVRLMAREVHDTFSTL